MDIIQVVVSESQLWSYSKHQQDRQVVHHTSSLFFRILIYNITYVFQVFICGQITIHNRGQKPPRGMIEAERRRDHLLGVFPQDPLGISPTWWLNHQKKVWKYQTTVILTWFNNQEVSRHGDFSPRKWWYHGYVTCWYILVLCLGV